MARRNPFLAAVLSLLLAGLGHLYLQKFLRAGGFFLLEVATALIYFHINSEAGALSNLMISFIAAYDAYKLAKEINRKPGKTDVVEIPEIYMQ